MNDSYRKNKKKQEVRQATYISVISKRKENKISHMLYDMILIYDGDLISMIISIYVSNFKIVL